MKILFDLIPVIVFFVAYFVAERAPAQASAATASLLQMLGLGTDMPAGQAPILLATALAIVATAGQVAWVMARGRKVEKMLWISLGIIVVMGGATLALRDPTFIKWKPTVLYWAFALVFFVSERFLGKNLIRAMTQGQIELAASLWKKLNWSWIAFFVFMGLLNIYVAFSFSESTWVSFKLFGGMGLMLAFAIGQGLVLAKHMTPADEKQEEK